MQFYKKYVISNLTSENDIENYIDNISHTTTNLKLLNLNSNPSLNLLTNVYQSRNC